jgi:hypothetical protein
LGEEYLVLLEDCPLTLWLIWDVCLGALDARLHLDPVTGRFIRKAQLWAALLFQGIVVNVLVYGSVQRASRGIGKPDSSLASRLRLASPRSLFLFGISCTLVNHLEW